MPVGTTPGFAAAACNANDADLAVEFHFNAAASRSASGTETLYWRKSASGHAAAFAAQAAMCGALGLPDRGLMTVGPESARAVNDFKKTRMPAILVEPAFAASNCTDNDRLQTRAGALCEAIARGIERYASQPTLNF